MTLHHWCRHHWLADLSERTAASPPVPLRPGETAGAATPSGSAFNTEGPPSSSGEPVPEDSPGVYDETPSVSPSERIQEPPQDEPSRPIRLRAIPKRLQDYVFCIPEPDPPQSRPKTTFWLDQVRSPDPILFPLAATPPLPGQLPRPPSRSPPSTVRRAFLTDEPLWLSSPSSVPGNVRHRFTSYVSA